MSKISTIIEFANHEKVRAKIAQILAVEIANQISLIDAELADSPTPEREEVLNIYKAALPTTVWDSRFLQPGPDELPFLNVVFMKSPLDGLNTVSTQDGMVQFVVEAWQGAETDSENRGDYLASIYLQRLLEVVRSILQYRGYLNLDLDPYVGNINKVSDIEIMQPEDNAGKNAQNLIYGKLSITIRIPECSDNLPGIAWFESVTGVELNESELGYSWDVIQSEDFLYNLAAAEKNIAPDGYRVPTRADYLLLSSTLSNPKGEKLKSTTGWTNPGTDEFGFNWLNKGYRQEDGQFAELIQGFYSGLRLQPNPPGIPVPAMAVIPNNQDLFSLDDVGAKSGLPIRLIKEDSTDEGSFTDIDGNVYGTTKIGVQVWATKNFRCTKYNDGTPIPRLDSDSDWENDTDGAYCIYNIN